MYAAEFTVPAGDYNYKVAVNKAWDESYGLNGGGDDIPLTIAGPATLRFVFDDNTKRVGLEATSLAGDYTAEDDALVADPVRQPGSAEQFYFVMTDRFANGDTSNDTGGLTGDRLTTGLDPTDKGFYQGGDLAGLRSQLDYIEGLGTSAIWLTPSFKNRPVQGEGENASAGYHGYWITDFTQIDPHLGTNAELEALIADAHARGIKVYFDIITNHTADVIDYDENQFSYIDQATSPYLDAAGDVFDPAEYAGTNTFPALDPATSFPYTPVIADADADIKVPAWLNDPTLYHNRGDSTWAGESVTLGDFVGLDDLMTEHPTVVDGFVDVYQDWVDLGIDGFRIDTAKHVNFEFWEKWSTEVLDYAHAAGKPDFFMFGEVYDADPAKLSPYVRKTDMNSVLDFTFQSDATSYAKGGSAAQLQALFAGDDMYTTPDSSATALPTFLGNHDMGRIGYFVAGADALQRDELAHELMYLTRGQPVVYYGDEQGFAGTGGDKDARQSLFATQTAEYANQPLVTGGQLGSQDRFDADGAALPAHRRSRPAARDPPGSRERRADRALRRRRRRCVCVQPRRPHREDRVPRRNEQCDDRRDRLHPDTDDGCRVHPAVRRWAGVHHRRDRRRIRHGARPVVRGVHRRRPGHCAGRGRRALDRRTRGRRGTDRARARECRHRRRVGRDELRVARCRRRRVDAARNGRRHDPPRLPRRRPARGGNARRVPRGVDGCRRHPVRGIHVRLRRQWRHDRSRRARRAGVPGRARAAGGDAVHVRQRPRQLQHARRAARATGSPTARTCRWRRSTASGA